MELSPGQRKAAFVVIVLALAGLGIFLVDSRVPGAAAGRSAAAASSHPATAAGAAPASTAPSGTVPATPAGTSSALPAGAGTGVDIYRLLPFTQVGLGQAVRAAEQFAGAYGTYSYRENANSYVATMRRMVTPQLAVTLERGYATPGVAQLRQQQRQVATGRGTVTALRAFGPGSLTFLVTVTQHIAQRQGTSQLTSHYAVTLAGGTGHWQVTDIQLASAGNS